MLDKDYHFKVCRGRGYGLGPQIQHVLFCHRTAKFPHGYILQRKVGCPKGPCKHMLATRQPLLLSPASIYCQHEHSLRC